MEITLIGYILIPLSIIVFVFDTHGKKLLYLTVFFSPFMATTVFNIASIQWGLPLSYYIGTLLIFKTIYIVLQIKKIRLKKTGILLVMTLVIMAISIIVAIVSPKSIMVVGIGNGVQLKEAEVSLQNITQFMYILFCFTIYWVIKNFYNEENICENVIRVLILSGIIVSIIGVYQLISVKYGLPYDSLFRTKPDTWNQTKNRVLGVMGEASIMGFFLSVVLSVTLNFMSSFSKTKYCLILGFISVVGILTVSTTFLLGGTVLLFTWYYLLLRRCTKKSFENLLYYMLGGMLLFFLIWQFKPEAIMTITNKTIEKVMLISESGKIRFWASQYMLNIGIKYWVIGIGFGSGRGTDLYTTLFAGVGLFGSLLFWSYIILHIKNCIHYSKANGDKVCTVGLQFLFVFLITAVSIPDLYYIFVWIMFAILEKRYLYLKGRTCQNDINENIYKTK